MPLLRRSPRAHPASTVAPRKPGLLARLTGAGTTTRAPRSHVASTTSRRSRRTRVAPVHHQRKPSMGDKVAGAFYRMKGKLTGRTGVTGAGTKRMRGTDGRGSRKPYAAPAYGRHHATTGRPVKRRGLF
ncbi:hypothetical protein BJ508DRAFT_413456 [Ascobolus immersus RN42]|uniref:Uncharacterized protein n=1 Tax=Ascobolus immersus RN42 TaxID=1160509 RepID=A0A3N4IFQ6_ASCIM|nr:hypothetical protein BJ508DRAFT_413456 [Ascobolus immersus RN42]